MKYYIKNTEDHTLGEIEDYFKEELLKTNLNKADIKIENRLKDKLALIELERIFDENGMSGKYQIDGNGMHLLLTGNVIEFSRDELDCRFLDKYDSILSGLEDRVSVSGEDLFEQYETLPTAVQNIILRYDEDNPNKYEESRRLLSELIPYGYTFEYGLCGEPHSLQKISQCDVGEWAYIKDWIVDDEGVSSNYGIVYRFLEESIPNCQETNWYVNLHLKSGESVTVNAHEIIKLY